MAHLARGRPRTAGGTPIGRRSGAAGGQQQPGDIDVVAALGNLGNTAKRQFQSLAANFQAKMREAQDRAKNIANGTSGAGAGGSAVPATTGLAPAHERRGLLDDDEDDSALEFASRKDL